MRHPIGDAEGAEFGEMAVIERQNKMRAVRQRLNGMAVAFREIPDVAGPEIRHFAFAFGIENGDARMALQHKRPFGGDGMPVQFAHAARFQRHVDAGHALGDRELLDGGFARQPLGRLRFLLSVNLYL